MPAERVVMPLRSADQGRAVCKRLAELYREHSERGLLVTVEPYAKPASNRQTTKLVLTLNDLATDSGNAAEAFRLWFRKKYFPPKVLRLKTTEIVEPKRYEELTFEEASNMIECALALRRDYFDRRADEIAAESP